MHKSELNKVPSRVILWGGLGQAKVVRPILGHFGARVVAVFDDNPLVPPTFPDVPIRYGWDGFKEWLSREGGDDLGFCVAIGNHGGRVRLKFHERLTAEGLKPVTIAHPTAWIEENADIGEGTQIMAGAFVGAEARLGRQCLLNTHSSVDHECMLGDGVEVAPGATICGLVTAETNAWICAGSVVYSRVRIGQDAVVGGGAVVMADVAAGTTVIGIPARPMIRKG